MDGTQEFNFRQAARLFLETSGVFIVVGLLAVVLLLLRGQVEARSILEPCRAWRLTPEAGTEAEFILSALRIAQPPSLTLGGGLAYFAYGLLLAWGYDKTRDLTVPILAHMLINTVAVALLVFGS